MRAHFLFVSALLAASASLALAAPPAANNAAPAKPAIEAAGPSHAERIETLRRNNRFSHLQGVRKVPDTGLRAQFQRTADALVELQIQDLKAEAAIIRDTAKYRTQRRSVPGPTDLQDLEPSHVPAVMLARIPL